MTKEMKQQYTLRITQANSSELVVILYEMLEQYIEDARMGLGVNDLESFHDCIRKCTGCLRELSASINPKSDVANNLMSLYIYCMKELAKADVHHTAEGLYHVELVIKKLHSAFSEVAKKDKSPAVMANTQSIYAGLTYGKESLVVNLNGDINRGYMA